MKSYITLVIEVQKWVSLLTSSSLPCPNGLHSPTGSSSIHETLAWNIPALLQPPCLQASQPPCRVPRGSKSRSCQGPNPFREDSLPVYIRSKLHAPGLAFHAPSVVSPAKQELWMILFKRLQTQPTRLGMSGLRI